MKILYSLLIGTSACAGLAFDFSDLLFAFGVCAIVSPPPPFCFEPTDFDTHHARFLNELFGDQWPGSFSDGLLVVEDVTAERFRVRPPFPMAVTGLTISGEAIREAPVRSIDVPVQFIIRLADSADWADIVEQYGLTLLASGADIHVLAPAETARVMSSDPRVLEVR